MDKQQNKTDFRDFIIKAAKRNKTNIDVNSSTCKDTSNSKVKQTTILSWIKKIFTMQTVTLLVGLIGLWFTYITFFQNKPGEIGFFTTNSRLEDNITTVFYGFEQTSDSVVLSTLPLFPNMANFTEHSIEDMTVIAFTTDMYKVTKNPRYNSATNEELNGNALNYDKKFKPIGGITYAYKSAKIFPMEPILWPIYTIYSNPEENLIFPIQIFYSFKSKKMTKLELFLVGLPKSSESLTKQEKENKFIKIIRPYLLECEDLDNTAIIYDKKIVQSPSKRKITKENFDASDISELK